MLNSTKLGGCECLHGTAVIDANGECRCIDLTTQNAPPRPMVYTTTKTETPAGPAATPAAAATIFGFNPLLVIGAVAAGLYFLSEKDGKTK